MYYAKNNYYNRIAEEIGEKEGYYIRKYKPALNTQIPKESDWKKFDVKKEDIADILKNL